MKTKLWLSLIVISFALTSRAQSVGGILSSNTVVCAGQNSGVLSLSSYTGSILRWEVANSPGGPWTAVMVNANTYSYVNLTQTTFFRVIVQASGFSQANSNYVSVICDAPSVAGTVSGNSLQCVSLNHTSSLSGNTGTTITWEKSTSNWLVTTTISTNILNITNTYNLQTKVRARVKNGTCPAVLSNTLTITPAAMSDAGQITGTGTVCATSNTPTLALNNYTGMVIGWESSTSANGPWNVISQSQNLSTQTFQNLIQTSFFRASVANANCPGVNSTPFQIQVDQLPVPGQINGTYSVCSGINTIQLQSYNVTGQLTSWESSNNGGSSWSQIATTNTLILINNLTNTTLYRTKIQNGICPVMTSPLHTVTAINLPTLSFQMSNACAGSQPAITNNCLSATGFLWDFGDGSSSSVSVPQVAYNTPGSYQVKLIATNSSGCLDSAKTIVIIHPKPSALLLSQDSSCFGNAMLFTNASSINTGSIQQSNIFFGDGISQSLMTQNVHNYQSEGTYIVSLVSISNQGCKDSSSKTVIILPKPKSDFVIKNACEGSSISPTNFSKISNGDLSFEWNFGNSFKSQDPAPKTMYAVTGSYNISLIATSLYNCSDTSYRTIHINETPTFNLASSPTCYGLNTSFTVISVSKNQSVTAQISYGDGTIGTTLIAPHHYEFPGYYHVDAIIKSDSGCVATSSLYVTVHPAPVAEFIIKAGCAGTPAEVSNLSYISKGSFVSNWSTIDGIQQKEKPAIFFQTPGTHSIGLIVVSENGCSDTMVKQTDSYPLPSAAFEAANTCYGLVTDFRNKTTISSGAVAEYKWKFSDNTSSTVENPDKLFLNHGTYQISLIAISEHNCSDTVTKDIVVLEAPIANFTASDRCLGQKSKFENLSVLKTASFSSKWNFTETDNSDNYSPEFLFEKAGSYLVKLKVKSSDNCVDSISKWVTIFNLPKVSTGEDRLVEKGEQVELMASGASSFNWYPAKDLSSPVIHNPFLTAQETVEYIVLGTDQNGCTNTDTLHIEVKEEFVVTPYNVLTPNSNSLNDRFKIKNIEAYPENHLIVFNQANQVVFETDMYHNEWDGKNQKGELLAESTYYYILTFKKSTKKYSGFISLIRN